MIIKPVVMERIQTRHTSFKVDLELNSNITFIIGDSGVGKSALFSFLQEMSVEDKRIRCLNYLNIKNAYKSTIKNSIGKLFVIDNADILLDDKMRSYIALDDKNQYIIIGRNPTGLLLTQEEILELCTKSNGEITEFSLTVNF